jgi:hypothetical protein
MRGRSIGERAMTPLQAIPGYGTANNDHKDIMELGRRHPSHENAVVHSGAAGEA